MPQNSESSGLSMAVYAKYGTGQSLIDLATVHLEADIGERGAAEAVARGYSYCGVLSFHNGESKVDCEPGELPAHAMPHAGVMFARMLGEYLKQNAG